MPKKKQLDVELMRMLAAFFVIFNHTQTKGFFLFSQWDVHSIHYWVYLFLSIFCKFAVPLFFMISGALLLNRPADSIKKLWLHRILHMLLILFAWSFFYYMVAVQKGAERFNLIHFLTYFYDSSWNFSYWYLYSYLAFLILLPILQRLAQSMTDREFLYFFLVYGAFYMLIPSVQYFIWQGKHSLYSYAYPTWISCNILIFPLAGYFLQHRVKSFWNRKRVLLLWGINICAILFSCYLTYRRVIVTGICDEGSSQTFHNTFVLLNSGTIFVTCQYLNQYTRILKKLEKPICSIGGCTLGIYLLHIFFRDSTPLFTQISDIAQNQLHLSTMLSTLAYCAIVYLLGYIITLILKRIPVLRKLVS